MNKLDLIQAFKEETGISRVKAKKFVELFFDQMADALSDGGRVEIRGLFSLCVREYQGYSGRNPATGDSVKVTPKKLPFFKCGRELRGRVNGREN